MMPVRVVILDCDGVMFRSEAANIAFCNAILDRVGEPPLDETAEVACHALASSQLFEKYYGARPSVLARIREAAATIDYMPFYSLMQPRNQLAEILGTLSRSYQLAMATNRGKTVQGVLDYFALRSYFDVALGVLDVERPKPHPDLLLECARQLSARPAESVYVGDQQIDARAARAAGMRFIGMGAAVAAEPLTITTLAELVPVVASLATNDRG